MENKTIPGPQFSSMMEASKASPFAAAPTIGSMLGQSLWKNLSESFSKLHESRQRTGAGDPQGPFDMGAASWPFLLGGMGTALVPSLATGSARSGVMSALGAGPPKFDPKALHPVTDPAKPFFSNAPGFVDSLGDKPIPFAEFHGRVNNQQGLNKIEKNSLQKALSIVPVDESGKVFPALVKAKAVESDPVHDMTVGKHDFNYGQYQSIDNPVGGEAKTVSTVSYPKPKGSKERQEIEGIISDYNREIIYGTKEGQEKVIEKLHELMPGLVPELNKAYSKILPRAAAHHKNKALFHKYIYPALDPSWSARVDAGHAAVPQKWSNEVVKDMEAEAAEEIKKIWPDSAVLEPEAFKHFVWGLAHQTPKYTGDAYTAAEKMQSKLGEILGPAPYAPKQHAGLYPGENNLGFARTSTTSVQDKSYNEIRKAAYFHELQSDWMDDLRKAHELAVPEPWPGAADDPNKMQQLMIKSFIWDRLNNGFDTFVFRRPVKEDGGQPQLYENLVNNLKLALKDLGPEFKLRDDLYSYVQRGNHTEEVMRPTVVASPGAREAVMKRGIRRSVGIGLPIFPTEPVEPKDLEAALGIPPGPAVPRVGPVL